MLRTIAALAATALLSACISAPSTSARPEKYVQVHAGRYDPVKQPVFMDCVFDGFLTAQSVNLHTHVRQVKRANGYRVEVIAGPFQYLVAEIRDDGSYELLRGTFAVLVPLSKEEAESLACLDQFRI